MSGRIGQGTLADRTDFLKADYELKAGQWPNRDDSHLSLDEPLERPSEPYRSSSASRDNVSQQDQQAISCG